MALLPFRLGAALRPQRLIDRRNRRGNPTPDWVQADKDAIEKQLAGVLTLPTGGWYAIGASRELGRSPARHRVLGRDWVVWRTRSGGVLAAPNVCPHMGARLDTAKIEDDCLVCPWHGLKLGSRGHQKWRTVPAHDDGVLLWIQVGDEAPTDAPILAPRPRTYIDGVIRMEATCEPRDVIQNRLDPWHGAWLHPYSFGDLEVTEESRNLLRLRVTKKIAGPLFTQVVATFHCPDARTIVMTIVEGEGRDSVVETHATPIESDRTLILEATLATSDRPGFMLARRLSSFIRPMIKRSATRLWIDDAEYAERLFEVRQTAERDQP